MVNDDRESEIEAIVRFVMKADSARVFRDSGGYFRIAVEYEVSGCFGMTFRDGVDWSLFCHDSGYTKERLSDMWLLVAGRGLSIEEQRRHVRAIHERFDNRLELLRQPYAVYRSSTAR